VEEKMFVNSIRKHGKSYKRDEYIV
jgi:hypothetical protein